MLGILNPAPLRIFRSAAFRSENGFLCKSSPLNASKSKRPAFRNQRLAFAMDLESLFGRGLLHKHALGDCNNAFRHSSGAAFREPSKRLFDRGTRRWGFQARWQ